MIEYIVLNPPAGTKKKKAKKKAKKFSPFRASGYRSVVATSMAKAAKKKKSKKAKAKKKSRFSKRTASHARAFSKASRGVARGNVKSKKRRSKKASAKRSKSVAKTKRKARRTAKQKAAARKNIKKAQAALRKGKRKKSRKAKASKPKRRKARKHAKVVAAPKRRKARRGKKKGAKKARRRARKWSRKGMDKGIRHSKFGKGRRSYRPKFRKGKQSKRVKANLVKYGYGKWLKGGAVKINPISVGGLVGQLRSMFSVRNGKSTVFTLVGMSAATLLPEVAGRSIPQLRGMQLSANSPVGLAASAVSTAAASMLVGKFVGQDAGVDTFKGGSLVVAIRALALFAPAILRKLGLDRAISGGRSPVIDVAPAGGPSSVGTAAAIQQVKGMGADFLTPSELVAGESAARGLNGFISMDGFIDPAGLENRTDFVPAENESF